MGPLETQDRNAGLSHAAEGTRTLSLLHGKGPENSKSLTAAHQSSFRSSGQMRLLETGLGPFLGLGFDPLLPLRSAADGPVERQAGERSSGDPRPQARAGLLREVARRERSAQEGARAGVDAQDGCGCERAHRVEGAARTATGRLPERARGTRAGRGDEGRGAQGAGEPAQDVRELPRRGRGVGPPRRGRARAEAVHGAGLPLGAAGAPAARVRRRADRADQHAAGRAVALGAARARAAHPAGQRPRRRRHLTAVGEQAHVDPVLDLRAGASSPRRASQPDRRHPACP